MFVATVAAAFRRNRSPVHDDAKSRRGSEAFVPSPQAHPGGQQQCGQDVRVSEAQALPVQVTLLNETHDLSMPTDEIQCVVRGSPDRSAVPHSTALDRAVSRRTLKRTKMPVLGRLWIPPVIVEKSL